MDVCKRDLERESSSLENGVRECSRLSSISCSSFQTFFIFSFYSVAQFAPLDQCSFLTYCWKLYEMKLNTWTWEVWMENCALSFCKLILTYKYMNGCGLWNKLHVYCCQHSWKIKSSCPPKTADIKNMIFAISISRCFSVLKFLTCWFIANIILSALLGNF